jgi:predicted AAA+ superfamily ATPase
MSVWGKDSYCLYGLNHVGKTSFLLFLFAMNPEWLV